MTEILDGPPPGTGWCGTANVFVKPTPQPTPHHDTFVFKDLPSRGPGPVIDFDHGDKIDLRALHVDWSDIHQHGTHVDVGPSGFDLSHKTHLTIHDFIL
jgi:hypothetical protein